MKMKEMTGKRFGHLTVLKRVEDHCYPSGRRDAQYLCQCDCGKTVTVLGIHLRSGHTVSCGCFRRKTTSETFTTHDQSGTRLYMIWKNMKQRCYNKNRPDYCDYGGRGIEVCDLWRNDFGQFYQWATNHGYRDDLSIDRINVSGNYTPENCRWVTQKMQCNNTRKNIVVTHDGETHTLKEWTERLNLPYGTISSRVLRGWNPERAVFTPVRSIEHN